MAGLLFRNRQQRAELRKFGLVVGTVFLVLGLVSWARGHVITPQALWTVGGLLIAPAVTAPILLAPVRQVWMAAARALGELNTRVVLTLLFYLILTPIGLALRLFRDPLNRSLVDQRRTQWTARQPHPVDPSSYERQF